MTVTGRSPSAADIPELLARLRSEAQKGDGASLRQYIRASCAEIAQAFGVTDRQLLVAVDLWSDADLCGRVKAQVAFTILNRRRSALVKGGPACSG